MIGSGCQKSHCRSLRRSHWRSVAWKDEGYGMKFSSHDHEIRAKREGSTHTRDRNAAEPELLLDIQNVFNSVVRRQNDRLRDEAIFVTLDTANHLRLCFRSLVVMDHTNTTK
jgi:hypothetical protein